MNLFFCVIGTCPEGFSFGWGFVLVFCFGFGGFFLWGEKLGMFESILDRYIVREE
jgi:hypothetical protein